MSGNGSIKGKDIESENADPVELGLASISDNQPFARMEGPQKSIDA